jgi:hypothetical protein
MGALNPDMNSTREKKQITRTPAPFLPGHYSLQAVSITAGVPDVTQYFRSQEAALRKKQALANNRTHSRYLLRGAQNAWDVYDDTGKLECLCSEVAIDQAQEVDAVVRVSREQFEAAADAAIGADAHCLVCVECHRGGSSADHSNFVVMMRAMIMDANEKDLEHFYVVESHDYDCRVIGLFAKMSSLSPAAADFYLDRYEWLSKSWPLSNPHHLLVVAQRIAQVNVQGLCEVVDQALQYQQADENARCHAKFVIAMSPFETRRKLAEEMLEILGTEGLEFNGLGAPETFDEVQIAKKSSELVTAFRDTLCP